MSGIVYIANKVFNGTHTHTCLIWIYCLHNRYKDLIYVIRVCVRIMVD